MRPIDRILAIIREHPEGLTTVQIGQIIDPEIIGYGNICSRIYCKASALMRYGLVTRSLEYRPNCLGSIVRQAVWRPAL